jgi:hypothetical protein
MQKYRQFLSHTITKLENTPVAFYRETPVTNHKREEPK